VRDDSVKNMSILAKKSLGQNFLTSEKAVGDIARAASGAVGDTILEIGPGEGALTQALLESGARVIAIEKDDRLIETLTNRFAREITEGRFTLIHGDALELDFTALGLTPGSYTLAANIPYYITGLLIRAFFTRAHLPKKAVLLVQKEVAERIVAKDGKESILSIAVKTFGTPRILRNVPRGAFRPQPKVDSAVLVVEDMRDPFHSQKDEEHFFNTLRTGFAHKRKRLIKNLACSEKRLDACAIDPNTRPENVSVETWHCITQVLRVQ
jgi:16S rRNA (adenine1518-N6/adenine1519-N6)-dimethyltransferase